MLPNVIMRMNQSALCSLVSRQVKSLSSMLYRSQDQKSEEDRCNRGLPGGRYVIEMKIWHGAEYNRRGEEQLLGYLEDYQLKRGYMLSFNFNQKKQIGIREVRLGDKVLIEAIV